MMKKRIEISKGFDVEEKKDREAFLKLNDHQKFVMTCQISEMMLSIQFENGVLPKDNNYTLTR